MTRHLVRGFWRSEAGLSAVEFAVVAPTMLLAVLAILNLSNYLFTSLEMRATANTAASFLMQGATDDAAIAATALASWDGRPSDAAVTLQRVYKCGDVLADASSLCSDGRPPAVYVTIKTSGTWSPLVEVALLKLKQSLQFEQSVRTR
jgi:Flp pilus assembly protein TadG